MRDLVVYDLSRDTVMAGLSQRIFCMQKCEVDLKVCLWQALARRLRDSRHRLAVLSDAAEGPCLACS
mgnify:CR=1 FL=1